MIDAKKYWPKHTQAKKDERLRFELMPEKIICSNGAIENAQNLLNNDHSICKLVNTGDYIVLDFGEEINGGISIETWWMGVNQEHESAQMRIRFGESVSECMSAPTSDHGWHDEIHTMPRLAKQEFGLTGFRFVRIDLLEDKVVELRSIKAVALERELDYKGSFESSDELLNQIWKVSARTVHLCCQDYLLDGIKRDRLPWVGDVHPQAHVVAYAFGDIDIIQETLDYLANTTPKGEWMNWHSSYTIWWIISLFDWYEYTANFEYLKSKHDILVEYAELLMKNIDETGREQLGEVRFIDWSIGKDEFLIDEGLQAMTVLGMKSLTSLFDLLGDAQMSARCKAVHDKAIKVDMAETDSKQVNSLRCMAGMLEADSVNEKYLSVDPFKDLSTWFGYYILNIRAKAGDIDGSLDVIRKYWGGMLELGATSFWEHYDINWSADKFGRIDEIQTGEKGDVHADCGDHCFVGLRHSFCHGWAGGPAAWLGQNILGVTPAEPGFKKVKVAPNLGDLDYAKGTIPTPMGIIEVSHSKNDSGEVVSQIKVPDGVEIVN